TEAGQPIEARAPLFAASRRRAPQLGVAAEARAIGFGARQRQVFEGDGDAGRVERRDTGAGVHDARPQRAPEAQRLVEALRVVVGSHVALGAVRDDGHEAFAPGLRGHVRLHRARGLAKEVRVVEVVRVRDAGRVHRV